MALVSEQVGTNEFQQFRQSLESFLLGALGIVSEKTHQFGYTDESMDGVKALLDHIKEGKDVSLQLVEGDDASLFASILDGIWHTARMQYVEFHFKPWIIPDQL